MSERLIGFLCVTTSALALTAGPFALAQQSDQPAASPGDRLEELVVTARRVEERQQAIPIAVSSLSATTLKNLDINKIEGVDQVTPNLVVEEGVSNGMGEIIYIRGIGAVSVASYSDPPVSVYIDGVVQARPVGNSFDLPDVADVEILRGPQGTLFGRNTTGGAVSITTAKPTPDFGGSFEFGYGNYNELTTSIVLNTGDIAGSGWRAKATFQDHSYDGWITTPGRSASDSFGYLKSKSGSFAVSKEFGDSFTLDNRAFINEQEDKPGYQMVIGNATTLAVLNASPAHGGPPPIIAAYPLDREYVDPRDAYDPYGAAWGDTLTLNYDVNDYIHLKSITGYRALTEHQSGQLGGSYVAGTYLLTGANVPLEYDTPTDYVTEDQESEEFQAIGTVGEFNYVAGLFYFHESVNEAQHTQIPSYSPTGSLIIDRQLVYAIPSSSYAGYFNGGYKPHFLDDRLELTGGVRYTIDDKALQTEQIQTITSPVLAGPQSLSNTWHNLGWSTSLSYKWTDDLFTYFRASSAYRAGAYNPSVIPSPAVNPEHATSIEAGVKSEWFDHRARLNLTAFETWYKDAQVSQRDSLNGITYLVNAGQATYKGFEGEGEALLGYGFSLNGTIGAVYPTYQVFDASTTAAGVPINSAQLAHFTLVSKYTWNIGAEYKTPDSSVGVFAFRANYAFQSSRNTALLDSTSPNAHLFPSGDQEDLKASVTWSDLPIATGPIDNLRLQLYGDNLTDHRYIVQFVDLSTYAVANYNRPRSFGGRIYADFGAPSEAAAAPAAYVPPPVQAPQPASVAHSYMVFFDFNRSDLTSQAVAIVDQAAKNAAPGKATELVVTGHTDTVGSDSYNLRLSRRRAESVAAELQKEGIPSSEIEIMAKGKHDLLVPTADGVREPQNRRVTIVYGGASS
jgi:iron complex outermembrane receptor protein